MDWQPISTAPRDGSYILLRFDGPFLDTRSPGVAVGASIDGGWWVTCIWAGSRPHRNPIEWAPLPNGTVQP